MDVPGDSPRVSVIIPCFNAEPYIESALLSAIQQSYVHKEIVVWDGGSSDGTIDILTAYQGHIDVLIIEPDNGPADAFNRAVARSTGELIVSLNADDMLAEGALAAVVEAFQRMPEAALIQGNALVIDPGGRPVSVALPDPFSLRSYGYGACRIIHPGSAIRRSWFEALGGFNVQNRTCWDGEMFVQLALAGGRIETVDRWLSCYRVHPGAISSSADFSAGYTPERRRLFRAITGRSWRLYDRLTSVVFRAAILIARPRHLLRRRRHAVSLLARRYADWLAQQHDSIR